MFYEVVFSKKQVYVMAHTFQDWSIWLYTQIQRKQPKVFSKSITEINNNNNKN